MALTTRCLDCGTRTKGARCATCTAASQDDLAARRKIRSGWEWGELRKAVSPRPRLRPLRGTNRLEVHHRLPLSEGGTNALRNLELLCAACHDAAHVAAPAEVRPLSRPMIA
jgi:5-methylcytosine-specific restriction endonuclease McrA